MEALETIIRFIHVSFDYGHDKTLLDEVSFSVRKGMKVALMGQNGAGKSTLFKLLVKEIEPFNMYLDLGGSKKRRKKTIKNKRKQNKKGKSRKNKNKNKNIR